MPCTVLHWACWLLKAPGMAPVVSPVEEMVPTANLPVIAPMAGTVACESTTEYTSSSSMGQRYFEYHKSRSRQRNVIDRYLVVSKQRDHRGDGALTHVFRFPVHLMPHLQFSCSVPCTV